MQTHNTYPFNATALKSDASDIIQKQKTLRH